jgi:hypothetical protein
MLHRAHDALCRRSETYAAWHEHPYHTHTHWFVVVVFLVGFAFGILSHVGFFGSFGVPGIASAATVGTAQTIDSSAAQIGDWSDIALQSGGSPTIVYSSISTENVYLARCTSATCTAPTKTTITATALYAGAVSIVHDASDNPSIVAVDTDNGNLHHFDCDDVDCAAETATTVISDGDVGANSVDHVLNGSGNPVIAWLDGSAADVAITECGNSACSAGNTTTPLALPAGIYNYVTVQLDASGFPSVVVNDSLNSELVVIDCGNATCSAGNTTTTLTTAVLDGGGASHYLNASGNPVISHTSLDDGVDTTFEIRLLTCGNTTCTSGNATTTVTTSDSQGGTTSVVAASSGNPIIGYQNITNTTQIVNYCGNATCSSGNDAANLDATAGTHGFLSMVVNGSDRIFASYYDITNGNLKFNIADNNANPAATAPSSILQATTGTGSVSFKTEISDTDADAAKVKVEVFDGSGWVTVGASSLTVDTATDATGITVATEGSGYHIQSIPTTAPNDLTILIATQDIANMTSARHTNIQIRVTPNDGTSDGTVQTSAAFTVDNAAPTGLGVVTIGTATTTTLPLTWATGATDDSFDHYEVWYGTTQSDVQNRTGTAAEWDNDDDTDLATAGTTDTTVTGLTVNTLYYVKLFALDTLGNTATVADVNGSTANNPGNVAALTDQTAPQNATNISVVQDGSDVLITWTDPIDNDLRGVQILRSIGALPVSLPAVGSVLRGVQEYRDSTATVGPQYNYALRVFDEVPNYRVSTALAMTLTALPVVQPPPPPVVIAPTLNTRRLLLAQYPASRQSNICTGNARCSIDQRLRVVRTIPSVALPIIRPVVATTRRSLTLDGQSLSRVGGTSRVLGRASRYYQVFRAGQLQALQNVDMTIAYDTSRLQPLLLGGVRLGIVRQEQGSTSWSVVTNAVHDGGLGKFTIASPTPGLYTLVLLFDE